MPQYQPATQPVGPLVIINNLPSRYRTQPFARLVEAWNRKSGNEAHVLYQAKRDPFRRPEWFFSSASSMTYPHSFLSETTIRLGGRVTYSPNFGARQLLSSRPTHLLVPGWDSPASLAAAAYSRATRARMVSWVESNPTTSQYGGALSNAYRRHFLRSAAGALVPTAVSAQYVQALARKSMPTTILPNAVSLDRLPASPVHPQERKRLIFVGDLSLRKGYDVFEDAACRAIANGWGAHAYGDDVEGRFRTGLGIGLTSGLRLEDFAPSLDASRDVWVIPSRWDPAPLTYSEALALGLRVVISDAIAYAGDAPPDGVEVFQSENVTSLSDALHRAQLGSRPSSEASARFTDSHWADTVSDFLLAL